MGLLTKDAADIDIEVLGTSTVFRCDGCGAQAYGMASLNDMMLFFCGHHLNKNTAALESAGWSIDNRTGLINKKPYEDKEE